MSSELSPPTATRRRCVPRPIDPGAPRPSDLLRAFFLAGLLFMVASAVVAIVHSFTGPAWLHWLALHLLLLGGVSQLVLGAGQFFACAFLATDPPPRKLVAAQLAAWNTGTVIVAVGVPASLAALAELGAAAIAVGLGLFALGLRYMRRRSLQRAPWALRWYQGSAACLGLGALIGVLIARGTGWPYGNLLGAHLAFNIAGWLGTAIVGTLHTFFPSLTQTQLRHPRLQRPTYILWLLGVATLAAAAAFDSAPALAAGWSAMLLAACLLAANLAGSLRVAPRPLALAPRLLALGQVFLIGGLVLALVTTVHAGVDGPFLGATRAALAVLLLIGWVGLTVGGSLLHLLAILGRIRRFTLAMPAPAPARERALTAAAAMAVTGLALSQALPSLSVPASVLTLALAALLGARLVLLASRALAPGKA